MSNIRILAIETSCDDTSMALVDVTESKKRGQAPYFNVVKNIVSSQTAIHRHWGGVVPNLAKREHLKNLPKIFKTLTSGYPLVASGWDLIAVTVGPGLEPSLWTGIEFAKKLSEELKVPLVGANHLEGHLYSNWLSPVGEFPISNFQFPKMPAVVLLVSGGHTILVHMKSLRSWQVLGETRDDAVGEAFDKVARLMGLPYPGGPEIEKLAAKGAPDAIKFPRPMVHEKNYEFSFSGLKTAVLYYLKEKSLTASGPLPLGKGEKIPGRIIPPLLKEVPERRRILTNVAASFQAAAIDVLVTKTMRAAVEYGAKSIMLCGGVAANIALRQTLEDTAANAGIEFFAPAPEYNTDNAAMIAAAAYMRLKSRKKKYPIEANSNLAL